MRNWVTFCLFFVCIESITAQSPTIERWDKRFGGVGDESFFSFIQTSDKGILLGGSSTSPVSGDKTQGSWGNSYDYWIIKIDSSGNKQWDKRFGGTGDDWLTSMQQTIDAGYIIGGYSFSGLSGDKTQPGWGGLDQWIVKIDSIGNKQWDKRFGGTADDDLYSLQQTTDGGYILGGSSSSGISGDKTQANWDTTLSTSDYWIVKIDSLGNKQWDKRYGSDGLDQLIALNQTSDGGYILAGATESDSGDDISQHQRGTTDYWIVKTDSLGNKLWDRRFGGYWYGGLNVNSSDNESNSLHQTLDGGYIVAGYVVADSGCDKSQNTYGNYDFWMIKLDSVGNKQWDQDYGGSLDEELPYVSQTSDGGYLISGSSQSNASGDKTENDLGDGQSWVVKTDSRGIKQWDKTIFTQSGSGGYAIEMEGGCYAIATGTNSGIGGYKTQPNWDASDSTSDYWIVKFCYTGIPEDIKDITTNVRLNAYPNRFTNELDITLTQQDLKEADFTICNLLGQTIYTQHETNLSPTYTKMLDLSHLPNGVYFVEVVVGKEMLVREVVKR